MARGDTRLFGNQYRWEDLRIVPGAFQFPGVADPTLSAWQPGGVGSTYFIYEFNNADEVHFTCQMPHSYVEGSNLRPHIHWTPRDRGVAENGNTVAWKIDYSIADIVDAFPSSTNLDLTDTCSGTNDLHEITSQGTITGTGLTVSHILQVRLYRDAGDTWATNTPGNRPCLLEFDIHFQIDDYGSHGLMSKN